MTESIKRRLNNIKIANEANNTFNEHQMNMICDLVVGILGCENLEKRTPQEVVIGDRVRIKSPINGNITEYIVVRVSSSKRAVTVVKADTDCLAKFCYSIDDIEEVLI